MRELASLVCLSALLGIGAMTPGSSSAGMFRVEEDAGPVVDAPADFRLAQQLPARIDTSAEEAAAEVEAEALEAPKAPVDLNLANLKELEAIPGVTPELAKRIVTFRSKAGRFFKVDDLLFVRGMDQEKLRAVRPWVTVKKAETGATGAPAGSSPEVMPPAPVSGPES